MKKEYDFSKATRGIPNAAQQWAAKNPAYYWKVGTKVMWTDYSRKIYTTWKATIKGRGRYPHLGRCVEIVLSDGTVRRVPPFQLVRRGK